MDSDGTVRSDHGHRNVLAVFTKSFSESGLAEVKLRRRLPVVKLASSRSPAWPATVVPAWTNGDRNLGDLHTSLTALCSS